MMEREATNSSRNQNDNCVAESRSGFIAVVPAAIVSLHWAHIWFRLASGMDFRSIRQFHPLKHALAIRQV